MSDSQKTIPQTTLPEVVQERFNNIVEGVLDLSNLNMNLTGLKEKQKDPRIMISKAQQDLMIEMVKSRPDITSVKLEGNPSLTYPFVRNLNKVVEANKALAAVKSAAEAQVPDAQVVTENVASNVAPSVDITGRS